MILAATHVAGCSLVEAAHGPTALEDTNQTLTVFVFMAFDLWMAQVIFA